MEMKIKKFKGVVHLKDGKTIESDWFTSDAYVDMFGQIYFEREDFVSLERKQQEFKVDVNVQSREADVHPFNHPKGKYFGL